MTVEQRALWTRLAAHVLDDPRSASPFSLRLAQENTWPPGFTQRVIAEYRRFAFLAVAAGHPVSPSDAIDQAWHLHLLYTRDYWGEFCPRVLGMPLHHGPARGGTAEKEKFGDWYARTLASYRQFFGEPPADLWPVPAWHPRARRVDLQRNWVIAKPAWLLRATGWFARAASRGSAARDLLHGVGARAARVRVGAALGIFLAAAFLAVTPIARAVDAPEKEWSVLNLRGPDFLGFFLIAAPMGLAAAVALRRYLSVPGGEATGVMVRDSYEAALLAGGPNRAFVAAVTHLVQRGLLLVGPRKLVRTTKPLPDDLVLLERAIVDHCETRGTPARKVRAATDDALNSIRDALGERGLVVHGAIRAQAHLLPLAVALLLPLLGAVKIWIGWAHSRPVGYLVALELIVVVVTALLFLPRPHASRRGRAVLQRMRAANAVLKTSGPSLLQRPDADYSLPLAVGLFGTAVLANTAIAGVHEKMWNAGDGSGSGGCSSSDSGGGGSCGGGDGGGCGGCGGD